MPTVLFLGATGCIGSSVLYTLQQAHPSYSFVALTRSSDSATVLSSAGVTPVVISDTSPSESNDGSSNAITKLASEADFVINCADNDDVELTERLLMGIKERWMRTGLVGTLIHTSGTAIFLDGGKEGRSPQGGKVWTDTEEDVARITPSMLHGPVDTLIIKAGFEGYVNTFIVCPSSLYGKPLGATGKPSVATRTAVQIILSSKRAFVIGTGDNVFGMLHINDVVKLYKDVFAKAAQNQDKFIKTSPYTRYYISNAEDVPWKTVMSLFAKGLKKRGLLGDDSVRSVSYEEAGLFKSILGGNSVAKAKRAADEFGWQACEKTFEESAEEELNIILEWIKCENESQK